MFEGQTGPAFAASVTDFVAQHWQDDDAAWLALLTTNRLVAPDWPQAIGGLGWSQQQMLAWRHACQRAQTPDIDDVGLNAVSPVLRAVLDDPVHQAFATTRLRAIADRSECWVVVDQDEPVECDPTECDWALVFDHLDQQPRAKCVDQRGQDHVLASGDAAIRLQLLTFTATDNLSHHGRGLLGWALIGMAIFRPYSGQRRLSA